MAALCPGDRVQFKTWLQYKGESKPMIPQEEWTGTVLSVWGMAREFAKVERDYDGRIVPVMQSGLIKIGEIKRKRKAKKRTTKIQQNTGPMLF